MLFMLYFLNSSPTNTPMMFYLGSTCTISAKQLTFIAIHPMADLQCLHINVPEVAVPLVANFAIHDLHQLAQLRGRKFIVGQSSNQIFLHAAGFVWSPAVTVFTQQHRVHNLRRVLQQLADEEGGRQSQLLVVVVQRLEQSFYFICVQALVDGQPVYGVRRNVAGCYGGSTR